MVIHVRRIDERKERNVLPTGSACTKGNAARLGETQTPYAALAFHLHKRKLNQGSAA